MWHCHIPYYACRTYACKPFTENSFSDIMTNRKEAHSALSKIEIPTLLFWENGNSWYGSCGSARFFIRPESPEGQEKQLSIQFWQGPMSMELSEILATAAFPICEEGLVQAVAWLEKMAQTLSV